MFAKTAVFVTFLAVAVPGALAAAEPAGPHETAAAAPPPALERTRVVFRIDAALTPERSAALERVLRAALEPRGVTLAIERAPSGQSRLAWIERRRADPEVLLLAILDADANGWQLYVVDAARGRASLRRLPGGDEADPAAPEAVATITETAALALREGLEVASEPVEAVVGGAATKPSAPAENGGAANAPVADGEKVAAPARASGFRAFGGLGLSVATLGDDVVFGANANAGARVGAHFGLRLEGSAFLPDRIESAYGHFELRRSTVDVRAQWLLPAHPFTLAPELGVGLELVRRRGTTAAASASASPDDSHGRAGGILGLRAMVPLSRIVAFELAAHATYSARSIVFSADDAARTPLLELGRLSVGAEAGVVFGDF